MTYGYLLLLTTHVLSIVLIGMLWARFNKLSNVVSKLVDKQEEFFASFDETVTIECNNERLC